MQAVVIDDNIVIAIYGTDNVEKVQLLHPDKEVNTEIPTNIGIQKGTDLRFYDDNWVLKPIAQLIQEGLESLPDGFKIVGNELVEMTTKEKIDAGFIEMPGDCIWDDELNEIRPMDMYELYEAGKKSFEDLKKYKLSIINREYTTQRKSKIEGGVVSTVLGGVTIDCGETAVQDIQLVVRQINAGIVVPNYFICSDNTTVPCTNNQFKDVLVELDSGMLNFWLTYQGRKTMLDDPSTNTADKVRSV